MSVQGRAVPLAHSTACPLARGGHLLLLGDVSARTPACRLTPRPAGPHGLSRLLLLTAQPLPLLPTPVLVGTPPRGPFLSCPSPCSPAPPCRPVVGCTPASVPLIAHLHGHSPPAAPGSASTRRCGLLAVAHRDGAPRGSLLPPLHPEVKGRSSSHSGWPGPAASQACSRGGDIAGGQAGPSLSWLSAPASAPGHWHHQEPGLAALAWPLPPGLVPRGCAAAQHWALLHADIPGGLSQSQLPPGRRARRRSSQGPLLRNETRPLRGGGRPQKPGDPQAPADPSAGSDGGSACRRVCLLQPPPRPHVPGQAACPELGHPRACVHRPSSALPRVLGMQRASMRRQAPWPVPRLPTWLCSLGACAGQAAVHGRPCHPAACWPLLLLSRGGHQRGGRGGSGFLPRGPPEAPPLHCDLTDSPRFLATRSGNNGKP